MAAKNSFGRLMTLMPHLWHRQLQRLAPGSAAFDPAMVVRPALKSCASGLARIYLPAPESFALGPAGKVFPAIVFQVMAGAQLFGDHLLNFFIDKHIITQI